MGKAKTKQKVPFITCKKDVCGGKPIIEGTRIKVSQIVLEHEYLGWTPDEIVRAHPHLTLAQVHAALTYYYQNPEEINAEIESEEELVKQLQREYEKVKGGKVV